MNRMNEAIDLKVVRIQKVNADRKNLVFINNNRKESITDGLAYDMDSKVPKMGEAAIQDHFNHSILSSRSIVQTYIVQTNKKERSAKHRNAKIRLSNLKISEIAQVFKGKSKWIKN